MLTRILFAFSYYSLYTTVVQATDSQTPFAAHTLQSCGNAYRLTPCRLACIVSLVKHVRWRVPLKPAIRLLLAYMSLLFITISIEIELNPRPSSFPCGSCGLAVLDEDAAVSCDNCEYWFHIQCEDISLAFYATYDSNQATDVSNTWVCLKCKNQNYSVANSHSFAYFESENSFSVLLSETEDTHSDSASPDMSQQPNPQTPNRYLKVPKLKILIVNFQSFKNKIPELYTLFIAETFF